MKFNKIATLTTMVLSGMYLTQCTTVQAPMANAQATTNQHQYPATRTHQSKEDRFLTGETGRPENLSSEGRANFSVHSGAKVDDGIDHYFGEKVVDKYRWFEELDHISPEYAKETNEERQRNFIGTRSESDIPNGQMDNRALKSLQKIDENRPASEVTQWVDTQNADSRDYVNNIPFVDKVRQNVESLYAREHLIRKSPVKAGGELKLFRGEDTNTRMVYIDGNGVEKLLWSEADSKRHLTNGDMYVNESGSHVVLLLSSGYADSDQVKLHVYETATGKEVGRSVIVGRQIDSRGLAVEWLDNDTFFYSDMATNPATILRRDLNKKRFDDPIEVHWSHLNAAIMGMGLEGDDKRYMVISTYIGQDAFVIKDLKTGKLYRPYNQKQADKNRKYAEHFVLASFVHLDTKTGDLWLISGENDEQHGELIKTNIHNLKQREVVVPANTAYDQMEEAIYHKEGQGYFLIKYSKDGQHRVILTDAKGNPLKDLTPSAVGEITDLFSYVAGETEIDSKSTDVKSGDESHLSFRFQNPITPRTVYKYSISKGEFIDVRRRDLFPFNHNDYEIKLVKYKSKDGTEIPMSISYKKGTVLNGKNPTLMLAYGGFAVKDTANFSLRNVPWLEHGGVFVRPHLRGGAEYGEAWHEQGKFQNKLNVFDDFEAAADYLTANGYTSPEYLAIIGGSNGGLLVGASMTLNPEKYRVAFPQVGVLDMLRHDQRFYKGIWDGEYGSAYDSKEMYRYLKSYSPYHNVRAGVCYPSTLVMTSKRDDRVLPFHSYKFAAALQENQSCANPTLLFADEDQGHGARTPAATKEAMTLVTAFGFHEMGIKDVPVVARPTVEELKGEKWLKEEAEAAAKKQAK